MKKLKIVVGSERHGEARRLVKGIIRIGLGLIMIFSFFLKGIFPYNVEHASKYDRVVQTQQSGKEQVQSKEKQVQLKELNREFLSCVKEVNGESLSEEDSKSFHLLNLNSQFDKINSYLQDRRINVHNLDIYLLKDQKAKNDQKRHWKLVKGKKLFLIDAIKALLINSLTKLVDLIQSFFPRWARTQEFFFYSEVCIKVLISVLLLKFLQENKEVNFQNEETLSENLSELFSIFVYNFVAFLPFRASFISILPPLDLQQLRFSPKWVILAIFVILTSTLLKEYTEENITEPGKERNVFLRKRFQFRVMLGAASFMFFIVINHFGWNSSYSKRNILTAESINGLLFLANNLVSSIVESAVYWKDRFKRETNEKAL